MKSFSYPSLMRRWSFSLRPFLLLILILCLSGPHLAQGAFTLEDEKRLGKEFYDNLEKHQAISHNQRATIYVATVGNKILANSESLPYSYRFSVIKSQAVNAFATPGGYVYINEGLLTLVESESELAGVLAHEIAHINARHIADSIEKSKKLNIATLAAVLAGAFLGVGADLGAAVASFSIAGMQSMSLKYSRDHEEEADRLGMAYLVSTGYDAKSMLDFFKIMRRYEFYSNSIPSYFLTHPGTDERIRYLDAMIQTTYKRRGKDSIVGNLKRIQTLVLLQSRDYHGNLKHFQNNLKKYPNDIDDLFGLAVTCEKLGQTSEAFQAFHKAYALSPTDADVLREMGIAYYNAGKAKEAMVYLQEALKHDPDNMISLLYLARSHESVGNSVQAMAHFKEIENKIIVDDEVYYNMAMIYGKTNHPYESHLYFGKYFKRKLKRDSAIFHFQAALKYVSPNGPEAGDIQKEILSLKKTAGNTGIRPPPK